MAKLVYCYECACCDARVLSQQFTHPAPEPVERDNLHRFATDLWISGWTAVSKVDRSWDGPIAGMMLTRTRVLPNESVVSSIVWTERCLVARIVPDAGVFQIWCRGLARFVASVVTRSYRVDGVVWLCPKCAMRSSESCAFVVLRGTTLRAEWPWWLSLRYHVFHACWRLLTMCRGLPWSR